MVLQDSAQQAEVSPFWLGRLKYQLQQLALPVLAKKPAGLLSIRLEAQIPANLAFPFQVKPALYWHQPDARIRLIGLGQAQEYRCAGIDRFELLKAKSRQWQASWTRITHGNGADDALAFVGFAFDPQNEPGAFWQGFPNAWMMVPELLISWRQDNCSIWFSCDCGQKERPEHYVARWLELLSQALKAQPTFAQFVLGECQTWPDAPAWSRQVIRLRQSIAEGRLSKAVLARVRQFSSKGRADTSGLLDRLSQLYPNCTTLACRLGDAELISATPERLVSLQHGQVKSDALAGTLGANAMLDECSPMRIFEHQPVVDAVANALQPLCTELAWSQVPELMSLGQIQHLWTRFEGQARSGVSLFDLAEALHPTPAVGGTPRKAAMDWIRAEQGAERGWYTGGFGWLGAQSGEIAVVLRCALIRKEQVHLFAGAGIQASSEPDAELRETEQKFATIQNIFCC